MYHGAADPRSARCSLDTPAGFSPEATVRTVLARIRKLLDAYTPGMSVERTRLPDALTSVLSDPALERERHFALGWLNWLNDDPVGAEPVLAEAMRRAREANAIEALAESAYWCARVRLLLGRAEALTEFESVLRTLGGSPRATAWFVDLLVARRPCRSGRAGVEVGARQSPSGRLRRGAVARSADAVASRRDDAGRALAQRGDAEPAASYGSNDSCCWRGSPSIKNNTTRRRACCGRRAKGRIPRRRCKRGRRESERSPRLPAAQPAAEAGTRRSPVALRDFLIGQQARARGTSGAGDRGLSRGTGQSGGAAVRALRSGVSGAGRSRRAARRASRGCFSPCAAGRGWPWSAFAAARPARRNVSTRFSKPPSPATKTPPPNTSAASPSPCNSVNPTSRFVRELAARPNTDAAARNCFRAALELAVRRLPAADAADLLLEWSKRDDLEDELRSLVGRQLLRLSLLGKTDAEANAARGAFAAGRTVVNCF